MHLNELLNRKPLLIKEYSSNAVLISMNASDETRIIFVLEVILHGIGSLSNPRDINLHSNWIPVKSEAENFYWCWKQRGLEKLTRQRARFLVEENANLVSKHTFP